MKYHGYSRFFEKLSIISRTIFTKSWGKCHLRIESFTAKNVVFELGYVEYGITYIEMFQSDDSLLVNLAISIDETFECWGYPEWCFANDL